MYYEKFLVQMVDNGIIVLMTSSDLSCYFQFFYNFFGFLDFAYRLIH